MFPGLDVAPEVSNVGRFVVHRKLGAGAMGVVFEAWDPKLDRKIALKVLRDVRSQEEDTERTLDEARALAQLRHANVISVHDVGVHEGRLFIAMDYVEGTTLGQWIDQGQPPARILDVFLDIARGLDAAHEAGIVHRDFKPDNVLVTADHEPLVVDFGVAKPLADLREVSDELIALAGTPAYMAPEQATGQPVDARADQFAFATVLYEALAGVRPFAGATVAERVDAAQNGRFEPPQSGSSISRSLRQVLQRALAIDPDQRYASMAELIDAIDETRRARRRRSLTLGAAAAVGLGALASFAATSSTQDSPVDCKGFGDPVGTRWTDAAKADVRSAFDASDEAYALDAYNRVEGALDEYALEHDTVRLEACQATHIDKTRSTATLELQVRCLDRRTAELEGLIEAFSNPSKETIKKAPEAIEGLTAVSACANLDELARVDRISPLPEDPRKRAHVEELQQSLARLQSLYHAGRLEDGVVRAQELLADAEELGHAPTTADARYRLGSFQLDTGQPQVAELEMSKACLSAIAAGDDYRAAAASATLAHVVGVVLRRHDEGQRWAELAGALTQRIGSPADLVGQTAMQRGNAALLQGQFEVGRVALQESAEAFGQQGSPRRRGQALSNLGVLERRAGNYDAAVARFAEAETLLLDVFGPHHPEIAILLNNQAAVDMYLKRWDDAEDRLTRALAITRQTHKAKHPALGHALNNLGEVHAAREEHPKALKFFDEALEIWTATLGDEHPLVAHVKTERALSLISQGRKDQARADAAQALEVREKAGATAVDLARTRYALAQAQADQDPQAARKNMERAREALAEEDASTMRDDIDRWLAANPSP